MDRTPNTRQASNIGNNDNRRRPTSQNTQPTGQQLHGAAQQGDIVDRLYDELNVDGWRHRMRNDPAFRADRMASTDKGVMSLAVITALLDLLRRNFPGQPIITVMEALVGVALFSLIVSAIWIRKQDLG